MESEKLSPERIQAFLDTMDGRGQSRLSRETYRRVLTELYEFLPEDKCLTAETGAAWRTYLLESRGLAGRTVTTFLSALNSFYRSIGRREWMLDHSPMHPGAEQPELTRAEYLRLLQAARGAGNERSYLLIKTLGGAGLRLQELEQLTAEAVREGTVALRYNNKTGQRVLRIPRPLRRELESYLLREGIAGGPVFTAQDGGPLSRSAAYYMVRRFSREARVAEEKATPRCLWRMYQQTQAQLQANIAALVEQAYGRLLEEEQLDIGWKV